MNNAKLILGLIVLVGLLLYAQQNTNGLNYAPLQTYPCTAGLYNGGTAITAGTYTLVARCLNIFGGTYNITAFQAYSNNNGASTCNAANNSGTGLLTTAVTASSTWAAGTQSATTTIAANGWVNFTVVSDGASTTIDCVMTITH